MNAATATMIGSGSVQETTGQIRSLSTAAAQGACSLDIGSLLTKRGERSDWIKLVRDELLPQRHNGTGELTLGPKGNKRGRVEVVLPVAPAADSRLLVSIVG